MNIEYKKLNGNDMKYLTGLLKLFEEVFEIKNYTIPSAVYLQTLLSNNNIIFYIAVCNHEVVGGLTAHILASTYFEASEVYLYDLAVKTIFQRKGIGRRLLQSLEAFCKTLQIKEIFVQADKEDLHAIKFYHATSGVPENVIHFSYDLTGR
jgi:aminoglycoside 3-N-acetyltransferase I